ncbi:DUF192 domain-containing protein [Oscillatoria laete-virens NRMC-F 0139]|nr:DUF192 domain-containing protein [Oscillatoria laete-virens]MDL5054469.1 DUF192 domain-containing protein [Oscillatoria laete-virens NRMC-F 0139]
MTDPASARVIPIFLRWNLLIWISLVIFFTPGCTRSSNDSQAQPKLRTSILLVGLKPVTAEIALTPEEKRRGLMGRTHLGENEGMLFVYPTPRQASFWMKNTSLPLSIAYADAEGVIQEIHDLEPHSLTAVTSRHFGIKYALEMNRGWFEKNGVSTKQKISVKDGDLSVLGK